MKPVHLIIPFLDKRNYLHGTSLFNSMISITNAQENIRLRIYKAMSSPVRAERFYPNEVGQKDAETSIAVFEFDGENGREFWRVEDSPNQPAPERGTYDELRIVDAATLDGKSIYMPQSEGFSFIERAVALNKQLLSTLSTGNDTRWWFCRLDLKHLPQEDCSLTITLNSSLNPRLTRSSISADGIVVGSIFFSEMLN